MGDYDNHQNEQTTKEEFLERDNYRCGIHIGGCSNTLKQHEANIDHIIPKGFYLADMSVDRRKSFNRDWNKQPMHPLCNSQRKIRGFPEFACECHWLMIDDDVLYVLAWGQRYALRSGITTSNPNHRLSVSVARPKPVRGRRTDDGRQLMRMDIVGGNAIVLPGVYEGEGNVAFFNKVAETNPTDINKYCWSGFADGNYIGLVGLDLT